MYAFAIQAFGWLWVVLLVAFLAVEAACPIHLVSIWFAVGSLVALVADLLGAALWLQIVLFLVVSGGLLAMLWPLAKKYMNPKVVATNVDSLVGSLGYVTEDIDNVAAKGQVKLGGMEWTARSQSGAPIPKGQMIKVERVEGVKAYVSPAGQTVQV